MESVWQNLKSPPVILAIFQLKITNCKDDVLRKMINNDKNIRVVFKNRLDNYLADNIMPGTPAPVISTIKANTHIGSYTYSNENKKRKLQIEKDSIVVVNEDEYKGWINFKKDVFDCLNLLSPHLDECLVNRVSIRFVNKFTLDSFEDPLDYFTQLISSDSDVRYPLAKYSFRLNLVIPSSDIIAIINNALEPNNSGKSDYYLDIDVLSESSMKFDIETISNKMEQIRDVKNNIFFDTVKQKTLDLCN